MMNKPQENFVTYYRTEGNYNLLDSSEVSAQYTIKGIDRESIEEEQELLRAQYEVEYAKYKVYHWNEQLKKSESNLTIIAL